MHSSPSPQARLLLSLLLSSLVVAAGCRGIQDPDSTEPTPDQPPAAAEVESVSQALAGVWTGVDIGATATGSSSVTGTTGTVTGGGADIWTATDAFRFHYMTVTGDVTITARVASMVTNGGTLNAIAKAGVMIRKNLTAGSQNAMMLLTPTASNGYRFQNRPTDNVTTARNFAGSASGTGWVRLSRVGNVIRSYYSSNGTTWTQLYPGTGTTPLTLSGLPATVEVGLAVTSHNTSNTITVAFDNITFSPAQNPPGPPLAPTSLTATPGNNQVALGWSASSGATSYTVKRSLTTGGPYTDFTATGVTGTSYTDTGASNGTPYFYVVTASNAAGESGNSNQATATPAPPPPPSAPTGLNATAGNAQVTLNWTAVSGATSYTVKRSLTNGGPYTDFTSPPITAGTSYTNTGLTNGTTYYYVVTATNGSGESGNSNQASVTPQPPPPPGAPTNLVATPGNAQVGLTWTAVSGATSYTVKRSLTSGGPYTNFTQAGITGTSYTNTGLTNGTTYYYVVTATGSSGESGNSNQASATPVAPPPVTWQSKIIGTVASGATGSWSQNGTTHTLSAGGSDIYGSADNFRFAYQSISGDVTITARVQSLSNTNVWAKAVVMIRENDTAGARNVATVVSPTASNRYRRQARTTAGGSSTSASSTANSAIPSWIRLQRVGSTFTSFHSTNGTSWTQISGSASLSLPATALVGLGVTSHTTTANTTATAVFTDVTVTTPTPPAPPATPTAFAAAGENKQVHLSWNPSAGATSYNVEWSTGANPFAFLTTVPAGSESDPVHYVHTGLTNGQNYSYRVIASNAAGGSMPTGTQTVAPQLLRPSINTMAPASGASNVPTTTGVALTLVLVNSGGGVDEATMNSSTVILTRTSDGAVVPASYNTSGGADVVSLTPLSVLDANTAYNVQVTAGMLDLTGAPFMPFTGSFTTGAAEPPPPTNVSFSRVQATGTLKRWTSITIGPDNKVYAATVEGEIFRWNQASDGTLTSQQLISTITSNNGGARAIIGLQFDPTATSGNLILWVTHGGAALTNAPDWTGKLTRLTGANLTTYQDFVTNFPRSSKDHMTNSLAFRPGEPGIIYIVQGSMNAMGAPDQAWANRAEHLLAAAVLRVNTNLITSPPLNVQTNDADPAASMYNPLAPNAPVTIWATGVRNAYDLLWHSNGHLYTATNGSASGGSTPPTTSPLPSACTRRIDNATNGPYTSPTVPGITGNPNQEDDYLFKITQGGYYGHPNPSRCEWVLNGGNPTGGTDPIETAAYPVGVQPDRNWRGPAVFNLTANRSPNGMIEWKAPSVQFLMGKLLIVRFSTGDDIVVLTLNSSGDVINSQTGIVGFTGFGNEGPLDITHNTANGDIYVTEYAKAGPTGRIWRLRPNPPQ